ncbi:ArfGap-domain-containing protein [Trametes versicolor FP-101664 SS1]|uniref:ArfGap-domain-containing protein n=1 Tax=Trametes versicolor (strain FP-101664) TaxID=717944 RepID=UPI0004623579|nr:ArfGap-domain-containing protein [Trametes versicolor FP-101664 SS1]EIW65168.1 ArfGap-domain-containing protein [Trametes versicolor FP-101664 SS1]
MSHRQDKATTERNSKTLRELLKRPENKTCADCKRNDPRWASWNLGVFLCIRCSGIHRSMGTHISKVKSVDLDVWTPEQMASIQKWGNRRANLYWEAHLRAGHVPPDHKMDSYIRSKYESRRWAREGPAPEDPAVLENDAPVPAAASSQPAPAPAQTTAPTHVSRASVSARPQQGQPHQLLSAGVAASRQTPQLQQQQPASVQAPQQVQPQPQSAALDLFSLDFHAPASPPPQQQAQPKKDVTSEIMSLFATAAPAAPAAAPPAYSAGMFGAQPVQAQGQFGQFGGMQPQAGWGQPQPQQQAVPQQTSMVGNAGVGMWGASSGWNSAPAAPPAGPDIWGSGGLGGGVPAQQQSLFSTSDVWSTPAAQPAPATTQKKDDVFGDLWGGFK